LAEPATADLMGKHSKGNELHEPALDRRKTRGLVLGAALIVLLTVLTYIPAMRGGFIWDDDAYVTGNMCLRSLHGLWQIWTDTRATPQYYPLTYTTFWVEYHVFGLHPFGYHVINILLHALGAVLLWMILKRLSVPGAWLAAAVFAIHPVNVESVAWITERKNTLSGVFYFLTVLAYLRYLGIGTERGTQRHYAAALFLFMCALLAKTATLPLPAVLLLVAWWKLGTSVKKHAFALIPFFALAFAMGQVTIWVERHNVGAIGNQWSLGLAGKLIVAGKVLWFYALKDVWPSHLTFIYPRWHIDPGVTAQYLYLVSAVAIMAALWGLRNRIGKAPLVALLFYGISIAPALGLSNVYFMRYSYVQDHFQYLASIGIITLSVGVLTTAIQRIKGLNIALPAVILLLLGTAAARQIPKFKDTEALWRDTLAKNPAAWMAYINLAGSEYHEGRYDEAIAQYQKCLKAVPDCAEAYVGMSAVYARTGRVERAIECLRQALKISPMSSEANYNYAEILAARGQYDEAIARYKIAVKSTPDRVRTHTHLGIALLRRGKASDAADHFMAALRINPTWEEAYRYLQLARRREPLRPGAMDHCIQGIQFELKGDAYRAIEEYQKAVEADPSFAEAYMCLGVAYRKLGEIDQAIEEYQAAIQIKPKLVDAHSNLAFAYYTQGDAAGAWEEIKLVRKYGGRPNRRFLEILSELMPEPK
jgi:tetratricopeptide (TPR) repeat protein